LDGIYLAVQRIVPRLTAAAAAFVMTVGTAGGCASSRSEVTVSQPPSPVPSLTLLDTVVLPSITSPPDGRREAWFGSLSGLDRDPRSGRYLAAIDDRDPSRAAWIDITADGRRLRVVPGEVVPIRPAPGMDERTVTRADLEALVALPDGSWVASEEGHQLVSARAPGGAEYWPPALLTLDASLRATGVFWWPGRFDVDPEVGGVRDNQGFEALARLSDGRLVAGLEQPLRSDLPAPLQNGHPFGGGAGGPSRLVELTRRGSTWTAGREWVYRLEATPTHPGFDGICDDGENGLTELLALDDTRLLALERACLLNRGTRAVRNHVRLFLADIRRADDVSEQHGAALSRARGIGKTLLLDFDSLVPQWPPALANLDNFEAMAFGPPAPDGARTLLVVSDDNFRATQRTVFLWFRIEEAAAGATKRAPSVGR
jgi:hypothetical protein